MAIAVDKGDDDRTGAIVERSSGDSRLENSKPARREVVWQDSRKNFGPLAGNGLESYTKNSASQGNAVQSLLPLLNEAVDHVTLPSHGPLVIADLGCATGPNCLKNVDAIVSRLKTRYDAAAGRLSLPTLQVFFQDLSTNDFNNLFHIIAEESDHHGELKYFAAGVPGTFYGRLFPESSVHVFFSSYSLHWMSRIPDAISDKGSPAYNKGRSWFNDAKPEVASAYQEQAASDLRTFLSARAEELVPGGLVFLLFLGRGNPDPSKILEGGELPGDLWTLVDDVWDVMVSEGTVSEEQRDSFNSATYMRSIEEVREALDSCSSEFRVVQLEELPIYHFAEFLARFEHNVDETPRSFGQKVLRMFKATKAPQIAAHLGSQLAEVFWEKYSELFFGTNVANTFFSRIKEPGKPSLQILVSLVRK